jgi:aryl-alcohol dehydrogenase-like predicted oxidoreductase
VPRRRARHIAFIPWFPLGHGDLSGQGSPLAALSVEYGATPARLALVWLLHRSSQILLIPGTSSISHLEDNMGAAEIELDERRGHRRRGRPVDGTTLASVGVPRARVGATDAQGPAGWPLSVGENRSAN